MEGSEFLPGNLQRFQTVHENRYAQLLRISVSVLFKSFHFFFLFSVFKSTVKVLAIPLSKHFAIDHCGILRNIILEGKVSVQMGNRA